MSRVFQSLFLLLASATRQELARQVKFLKAENELLRSRLPKRITVTPKERSRLVRLGRKLGSKVVHELLTIVSPATFLRWVRESAKAGRKRSPSANPQGGRPKTSDEIREIVLKLARENSWGYTRIRGELRKLGATVCRQTVNNILRENGFDIGPKRGEGTWDDFLRRHADTLWQCDFLSVKAMTRTGFLDLYLLAFLHLGTRRAWISPATEHPESAWVAQQARNFLMHAEDLDLTPKHGIHDWDTKFTRQFDDILESAGAERVKIPVQTPVMNAHVERFIKTVKFETLHFFLILGKKHLNHIIKEFVAHYNRERSHSSRGFLPPGRTAGPEPVESIRLDDIACDQRLGGLLKHYWRRAA